MDDAALAAQLVTEAASLAARMRTDGLTIGHKTSISDLVTDADRAAETLVVDTLAKQRPADGILGEEGAAADGTSGRRWIIDPVDGTYNFAAGMYHWCSAVALHDGDDVVLGAIAHHASGTVLVGGPDLPTTRNGEPVEPLADRPLAEISAATYLHPAFSTDDSVRLPWLRAAARPATIRMLGSGSMEMVGIVSGELGCWFQHSTPPWDWFPGAAIVRGAGGAASSVEIGDRRWFTAGPAGAVAEIQAALQG